VGLGCALGLVLLVTGCTVARYYRGAPLHGEPSALVEGQSTKSDVLRMFGPPTLITHQTDGDAFVYTYQQQNFSSFTVQEPFTGQRIFTFRRQLDNRDTLVVFFDFVGVVRGVAADHQTEHMPPL
jgi:outer membrane protein assembly factor BamE (lipoprotein component of BamABCDE complex)